MVLSDSAEVVVLALGAFCLGMCPFSLWAGRLFLDRDIRDYGEGNPGATNVFRAGGRVTGVLAVTLDMVKGVPLVALAHYVCGLPERAVLGIGMCAILGNAFSPLLRFRGGKSLAVTGGVLLGIPDRDIFLVALLFICAAFLFLQQASWIVMVSVGGTTAYLAVLARSAAQVCFMLGVLVLLGWKHRKDLRRAPTFVNKPTRWLRAAIGRP